MAQKKFIIKSSNIIERLFWVCAGIFLILFNSNCGMNRPTCVSGNTFILTPNGNIPAEKLKIGDQVYSYDLVARGVMVPAKIAYIRRGYDSCIRFDIDTGVTLNVTAEHPVYSPETGNYEKASKWRSGELSEFYTPENENHNSAIAVSMEMPSDKIAVYDISVDSPFRNFIANGVLVHNKTPPLEVTPPVDDLEVVRTDSNSITLAWTVPGDSLVYPAEYDIRYLNQEWEPNDFWTALDTVAAEPTPSAPGSRDSVTVDGLADSTTYWFGMRTISNDNGYSNLSNIVSGITQ